MEDFRKWYVETRDSLIAEFYASGYPPGTQPSSPRAIFDRLIALRAGGSPVFWQSQEAQDELRKLEQQFGPAPRMRAQPTAVDPTQFDTTPGGMQ